MPKASKARRRKQNQNRPANQEQPASAESAAPVPEARPRRQVKEMSPRARLISLVFGDILCFLIFASLGTNAHGKGINVLQTIWVAIPFAAAWFLVGILLGAFREDIATNPKKMMLRTFICWLFSWPVAMLFRWLLVERFNPVPLSNFASFAIVAFIANLTILVVWRWPFALNNSLRKRGV
ncbi:MAG TPA: DUF3054 domain-containing protein [Ktedonobacteraceae bacterium]